MEKIKNLPITIQQAKKNKITKPKKDILFAVKKYNEKKHLRISYYKPISKILLLEDD